jgi:hypothetical protein
VRVQFHCRQRILIGGYRISGIMFKAIFKLEREEWWVEALRRGRTRRRPFVWHRRPCKSADVVTTIWSRPLGTGGTIRNLGRRWVGLEMWRPPVVHHFLIHSTIWFRRIIGRTLATISVWVVFTAARPHRRPWWVSDNQVRKTYTAIEFKRFYPWERALSRHRIQLWNRIE